ncbi:MAG: hypothetical protein O4965_07710, partial [Trichodesmium sp. St19_bin1]|nr:hypothetical protein [Trichodesmium sp. St19_bin1]
MVRYRVSCPPGNENVDLIVSLLAILLVMLVITAGSYQDINTKYQESVISLESSENRVKRLT